MVTTILLTASASLNVCAAAAPLTTAFTYQGQLKEGGAPASGAYDFELRLFDLAAGGAQHGPMIPKNDVLVENGLIKVDFDFGNVFDGNRRWLDVRVRPGASAGAFIPLTPRQELTATPYATTAAGLVLPYNGSVEVNGSAVSATNSHSTGYAVSGISSATGFQLPRPAGVYGESAAGTGSGVFGKSTANTALGFGVWGTGGTGVRGDGLYTGVWGEANGDGARGVYGKTGFGATGVHYGGYFEAPNSGGIGTYSAGQVYGVWGNATGLGATGFHYGGYFEAPGALGVGAYGAGTTGVHGEGSEIGIIAEAPHIGVIAEATGDDAGVYGVYARSISPSGADFYAAGAGLDYGSSSSIRWKCNVEPIHDPLEKLGRLRGVYFDWDAEHGGHHDVGMIAEEVGAVLPEIVNYEENGIDANGMDYAKLTPVLVEALRELRAEKTAELAELRKQKDEQIAALAARLARLESLVNRMPSRGNGDSP